MIKEKKVRFLEEGLEDAKSLNDKFGYSPEYFMFKIDKFFANENSVVLLSTDTKYEDYLN